MKQRKKYQRETEQEPLGLHRMFRRKLGVIKESTQTTLFYSILELTFSLHLLSS